MKRVLLVLITLVLVIGQPTTATAATPNQPKPCGGWRYDLSKPAHRAQRGPRLVACVFKFLDMPDEVFTAQAIAYRESRYDPDAYNPSGCGGIFQHMLRYWRGRALSFLPRWRFPHRETVSWRNALANVWVAARMVKAGGWGPWKL